MRKVKVKQIHLVNYKGHKDLTIDFSDNTTISGANALGKSTSSIDAFTWLLFGKDQFGRENFEIYPIVDGKQADRVDSVVESELDIDNRALTLKRVFHQKWERPRGQDIDVYKGNETLYYINDVPLKASEYKARVDMIIEETVFKLITNPSTFLSLHWEKQRAFLFQVAGTLSDNEIAANNPEFSKLLELVGGKSLIEFKKELTARKKRLKDDLDNIQPRIDQTSKLMPANRDFVLLKKEIKSLEIEINTIDLQISNNSESVKAKYHEIQALHEDINELKSKQREIENNAKLESENKVFESNKAVNDLNNQIKSISSQLMDLEKDKEKAETALSGLKTKAEQENIEVENLRKKWGEENKKEYSGQSDCLICPIHNLRCETKDAIELNDKNQLKAQELFIENKSKILANINSEGTQRKNNLVYLQGKIIDGEKYISEIDIKLAGLTESLKALQEQQKNTKIVEPQKIVGSYIPEWAEMENQIEQITKSIPVINQSENTELLNKKAEFNKKRDELLQQLGDKELIEKYNIEISELEKQGKNISQQIADLERTEFSIDAFNKVKITELDKRINSMFKIVKFKLFDYTIEGNEFECCIPTNKAGVLISATNTAERINAGLDIINTLSKFHDVSAPIFCDGSESVNDYIETNSQMIFLRVTNEQKLTIINN